MRDENYKNQFSGQIGESLVVAEHGKRGIIATAFAGNVPEIDILAYKGGNTVAIQVKTWRSGNESLRADRYLIINQNGEKQKVLGIKKNLEKNLIYVFVNLSSDGDKFYILNQKDLAKNILKKYKAFLKKHNYRRPRNPETKHHAVRAEDLKEHEANWSLIEDRF